MLKAGICLSSTVSCTIRWVMHLFCALTAIISNAQTNHTLSQPAAALDITATTTNPTCATRVQPTSNSMLGNGSINATATGGTPPYTYSLALIRPNQASGFFPDLDFGNYRVVVTDAGGATTYTDVFLTYTLPQPLLDIHILQVPSSCSSQDGNIDLIGSGGTPPYTYSTDGAQTYHASPSITGLEQGYNYVFYLKDANGCLASSGTSGASYTAHFFMCPACCELQLSGVVQKAACSNDGELWMAVDNDAGPIYYSLDGVNYAIANGTNQNVNIFSNLTPGTYHVYAKNDLGYTGQASFTISKACATTSFTAYAVFTPEHCDGRDASITLTGTNGTAPYLYTIDGIHFATSNVFPNLAAGTYTATIKDATGAIATTHVTVIGTVRPVITDYHLPPFCENDSGRLGFLFTGLLPFQYSTDNGVTWQTENVFKNLSPGNHPILMQDASGCKSLTQPIAMVYPVTPVNLGNDTTLCTGQSILLAAPYSASYQYRWQDNSQQNQFEVTAPGTYSVTLTNENQCLSADTIQVKYTLLPAFTLGPDTTLCAGSVLKLNPSISGNFLWSNGSQGPFLSISGSGLYWLQESNQNCVVRDSILVRVVPRPAFKLGSDTILCTGDQLLLDVTTTGASYQWQDGSTASSYTVFNPGMYSVKVSLDGCDTTAGIKVDYLVKPNPPFGGDTTLCIGQHLLLHASSPGADYLWQDGSSESEYTVQQDGKYSVYISNLCGSTDATLIVKYDNCQCNFFVPNAFTPNQDGKNDLFRAHYRCLFDHFSMKIFNRWGQMVFASSNPENGWDGTRAGARQEDGVYIWMISYHDQLTNKTLQKTGTLVLTR